MNLYTDDNPKTTLRGLGFKNKKKAEQTILKVENYFDMMHKNQQIPGWTPDNVLPKKYLKSESESFQYYLKQKMYRILGMSNRAKGMLNKIKDIKKTQNFKDAINVFEKWMTEYHKTKNLLN